MCGILELWRSVWEGVVVVILKTKYTPHYLESVGNLGLAVA
jgi:hypothetical protein